MNKKPNYPTIQRISTELHWLERRLKELEREERNTKLLTIFISFVLLVTSYSLFSRIWSW